MPVSFIGEGNWSTDKLSHNVVLSAPRLSGIRTHNVSGVMVQYRQFTLNN